MATRRERLERKQEKRQEWAGKAASVAAGRIKAAQSMADHMTGEPVKVGHHSEGRHRRDMERMDTHMRSSVEATARAAHHESKADGLALQLKTSIFSDDADAIDRLREKLAGMEAKRDKMKANNAALKKHGAAGLVAIGWSQAGAEKSAKLAADTYEKTIHAGWEIKNLGAEIRRAKKRIEEVTARQAQLAKAEAAPGGVLVERFPSGRCRVTFAEKPDYAVILALKAAGYGWADPSWIGPTDALPEGVEEIGEAKL